MSKLKRLPVKTLYVKDADRLNLSEFPSFSATGSVAGMKKQYYGKYALLVRCGGFIYNVSSNPAIYHYEAH
jgi:hypothetical protein